MKNLWLFFLVALSTGFISDKLLVLSHSTTSHADDLYIEDLGSGDIPIDDEDGEDDGSGSGSGSGDGFSILSDQDEVLRFLNITESILHKVVLPLPAQPTVSSFSHPQTTSAGRQDPEPTADDTDETPDSTSNFVDEDLSTNASPVDVTTDFSPPVNEDILVDTKVLIKVESDNFPEGGRNSRRNEVNSPQEVTSENLWERTEVLAAVIACGVVGFLCAISLLLLLAYRMKKKDEGSYALGDTKMSATAYHKAPTKEFYA